MHNVIQNEGKKIYFLNQRSDHGMQNGAAQKMVPVDGIFRSFIFSDFSH